MRRALAGDLYHLGACAVKRYLRWIQSNYWGLWKSGDYGVLTRSG